jgi:hypothetical protein
MMPVPVRISVNGIRQAGQRSSASIAGTCSGSRAGCKVRKTPDLHWLQANATFRIGGSCAIF